MSLVYVLRLELITRLRDWKDSFLRPGQSAAQHSMGLSGLDPNGSNSLCHRIQSFVSFKQNGKISSKVFKNSEEFSVGPTGTKDRDHPWLSLLNIFDSG